MYNLETKIKKFEYDVDCLINNMNIYKNNWDYLLQGVFTVFEYRVDKIAHQKNAETLINIELTILDKVIRLCSQHERITTRRDANENKVNTFFENVNKYLEIENSFILNKNGYYDIKIEKNNVYFTNIKIEESLEIINFYNKLNFADNFRERFSKGFTYDRSNIENFYKDIRKGIENTREYKENILLHDNIYIDDIYDVYSALMVCSSAIKCTGKFNLLFIEEDNLFKKISRMTNLNDDKVKNIITLLSYEKKQKIDIIHTPLFYINDLDGNKCYLSSPSLIINSNIERNLLILIQEKLKIKPYDGFQEKIMCNNIEQGISCYNNLYITTNVKLLNECEETLTDIDMVIFDDNTNSCICCELKNFMYADSLQQHMNIQGRKDDQQLNKAYEQVQVTKNYFTDNFDKFETILKSRGINIDKQTNFEFVVVSSNNLGFYSKYNINIIETHNLIDLFNQNKGNLKTTIQDIQQNIFKKNIRYNYICQNKEIEFAGYKIQYPYYYINHFGKIL